VQCFAHPAESAVGICKSCGKGICRNCAIHVDRGLACSMECKPIAEGLSRWQKVAIRNVGLAAAQRLAQPLMAILFLAAGISFTALYGRGPLVWIFYGGSAVFALTSVMSWVRIRAGHSRDS
jgi:hypothetical protein